MVIMVLVSEPRLCQFLIQHTIIVDTRKTMITFVSYTYAQWMEICEYCVARELISTLFLISNVSSCKEFTPHTRATFEMWPQERVQ